MKVSAILIGISLVKEAAWASHNSVPLVDPTNVDDFTPDQKPRYLKNPTNFKLIGEDDGSIESYADDKVHSVTGTYSTWVDKKTKEYFLYVRPVLLSRDNPDRLTLFAQISS